ncbi:Double Clp-N motif-containing P-loop nucleoside triphosphate hydrolases superfamily protein [Prunus dulcis]|uniref:Double Clp-N motif-containing P-loop nucleoside triphosphate hydrolases superfamily protein n=2 Tax=Prunus TaxID=3754 RepID=A0A4Y1QLK6_PRUDU|nr:protein SMAX1-LIKE 4-like [Prunus dulcis]BBG92765.1 Double Clp-N motif-containing P-loop nucleoside triphosphate hydrolases superfamily protein [Prunus dulcis]VVA22246.1 PREDICTED: SMAX1-LIKE [Prunus dulcis]
MRSGTCAVQQTLTAEAASVLKHSLSLARRRGHAQVTPLHVAATLLSSRTSLLRRACLKSQPHQTSHPLQCRALELCFNVALNRLPTTPGPLLHGQPSLSNALIAALKRAQAHQRRGCIEQQQQQPLLTIKVELEQLIISILDDPSVSRVMREAGFSSTNVKNNLEDTSTSSVFQCYSSSGGVFSSPCSPSPPTDHHHPHHHQNNNIPGNFWQTHFLSYTCEQNPVLFSPQKTKLPLINPTSTTTTSTEHSASKEDIKLVFEVLLRKKKRNTVIVGDSMSITEGLVSEVMGRIERGIQVPEELKSTYFIKFQFSPVSLRFMKREDVEANLSELKRKIDSSLASGGGATGGGGGGAIIYTGDLKWTINDDERRDQASSGYSPVEHLVAEISRLVSDYENSSNSSSKPKVWLMATASYQTYMRCQMRQPPLEIQWCLQAVSVPSGGLGLSLHGSSVHDSRIIFSQSPSEVLEPKPFNRKDEQDHNITCCEECTSNYEKEAQQLKSGQQKLPAWLQPHGTEARQKDEVAELRRKWNRLCYSLQHQGRHAVQNHLSSANLYNNQGLVGKNYSYASTYPWWSTRNGVSPDLNSISFGHDPASDPTHGSNLVPRFRRQQSCTIEFNFDNGVQKNQVAEPSLDSLKSTEGKEVKITLALGNSVFSDSGKSVERKRSERTMQRADMCKLLKENVPWQSESIPSIVEAIIDSKSSRQETWLLIQGNDSIGKRRLAQAIAELVMGSTDSLLHFNMNKRDNEMNPRAEVLGRALKSNEKLVVLVEDVDLADTQFLKFLADGFETRKFGEVSRREGNLGQAIFILTKGDSTRYEDKAKYLKSIIQMTLKVDEKHSTSPSFGGVNFDHKRKAEWELQIKTKTPRIEEKEDQSVVSVENVNSKKDFSRQSSFNTLDLNLMAGEDDEIEDKAGELSPISSDLTRETTTDLQTPHGFLESIENMFVFNRSPARDREISELFMSKIEGCFEEVYGKHNVVSFSVDKRVLEGICNGSGYFPNSLFEKWLKDIFQTRLRAVKLSGKEGILVRLCLGDKEEGILEGFLGSCLPKKIQIS